MSDTELLRALADTDPCPGDSAMPTSAWSPDDAFTEVERLVGVGSPHESVSSVPRSRHGWMVAAAAFFVILIVGGMLYLAAGSGPHDIAPADTTPVPTTTPPEAWALVSAFYESLNTGDIPAAQALFAPGGIYVSTDYEDVNSSSIGYGNDPSVASAGMQQFWTWKWQMLQTQWSPRSCEGTATTVICETELNGVISAHLPGNQATGRVVFTITPEGIAEVVDKIVLGSQPYDIRSFWRTGLTEIAPDLEGLWPGGNGMPPFTTEFARIILELYPQWLADSGVPIPTEYLDGTLLNNL